MNELQTLLDLHNKWLIGDPTGVRLSFKGADLTGVDFDGANMRGALLTNLKHFEEAIRDSSNFASIKLADLTIDQKTRKVYRSDILLELSPTEYALLEYLALNSGRILSREELAIHVWGIDFGMSSNTIDVIFKRVREKVDEGYGEMKLLYSQYGCGYGISETGSIEKFSFTKPSNGVIQ